MRFKRLKYKAAVLYAALLCIPTVSLEAQEVDKDTQKLQQDIQELRQDVQQLKRDIWQLQQVYSGIASDSVKKDGYILNTFPKPQFIHRLGVDGHAHYIFPTNPFLQGENERWMPIRNSYGVHLKYSFQFRPNTLADRIYGGAYQGIGASYTTFGDKKQLGDPFTFYLFQGARIAQLHPRVSLNYEWNFGISSGWQPYNNETNTYNGAVGSRMNAYINAGLYLNWAISRHFDLNVGVDLTHFSNGNTMFPNSGINTGGARVGVVYNFNREEYDLTKSAYGPLVPSFPRHMNYDLMFFGSWRRKGVFVGEEQIASPNVYPVAGFNFAPMYNVGYKFRFGVSLDGVYDGSANVYTEDVIVDYGGDTSPRQFLQPAAKDQLSLGLSGRAEYVMPYFTIGVGLGSNIVGKGDLKGFYQVLALKIKMTHSSFLHIGYNLQNFKTPNYLMLGIGYRFHNKYPKVRR